MRSLKPSEGLCNGARLLVQEVVGKRIIIAKMVTGTHAGDIVGIPRYNLSPEDGEYPFTWSRRPFPILIAFCMTINKAQGQTLSCELRWDLFEKQVLCSWTAIYAAASRVGHLGHLRFAIDASSDGSYRTANNVYKEMLT